MTTEVTMSSEGPLNGTVAVPPSKSYTHRAVITACLALGRSEVFHPLRSRDTVATFEACKAMGAGVEESGPGLVITGSAPMAAETEVNVENSGTTLRFMTSVFTLPVRGTTVLTGDASIRQRPMQGLLDALAQLGAKARSSAGNGRAPIVVGEGGMQGGNAELRGDVSSQFVSSILISAPLAKRDSVLRVLDPVSRPYIDATLGLLKRHGIEVEREGYGSFAIPGHQEYRPANFTVPADFSSAAFAMAATALLGGRVELLGLTASLPQADSAMLGILEKLGAGVESRPESVVVKADGSLMAGGSFDLGNSPDLLPVLAALALRCEEPLEVRGVSHARFKETDRISVLAEGLTGLGAKVEERADGMKISRPVRLTKARLDAHGDHRMFMAFALASLLAPGGIPVTGAESLDVSYPGFLTDMEKLGVRVKTA